VKNILFWIADIYLAFHIKTRQSKDDVRTFSKERAGV